MSRHPSNYCPTCGSFWPYGGECDWCDRSIRVISTKAEAAVDRWTDRFILVAIVVTGLYLGGHALVWLAKIIAETVA